MIYAKTPMTSTGENGGQNVIYMTIWKIQNNQIIDNSINIIKNFGEKNNI